MKNVLHRIRPVRMASVAAMALVVAGPAFPAMAQETQDARLRRIESEVRALQRKVFPGADGRFFEPQITQAPTSAPAGAPATTAVTDLLVRMDSLEAQIARLTAQTEQNTNRIAQLEARMTAAPAAANTAPAPASGAAPTAAASNLSAMSGGASEPRPAATPAASGPSAERLAAVRAIVKPQTSDAGDDEYSYGFRLWEANFFPEAQQQLKLFVDRHPRHSRISFGRNLLGRAFLDDGKPREAASWFLQNYQADKNGARAPDSLLYLGRAMKQLKDTKRACIALAEFSETYAAEAAGRLKSVYDATRNGLDCG